MDLPTVELIDQAFYWVKPAYGDNADRWTVACWSSGCFWAGRQEVTPSVISGPIHPPADVGSV